MLGDLLLFLALVGVVAAVGIRLGMLVAPRLTRLAERTEEPRDGDAD